MDNTIRINNIIYKLRKAKGMTQKELAEKLHTTSKAISNWERDKNCIPAEMILKVAKELGVDKEFLCCDYKNALPHTEGVRFFYCPECKSVMWSFSKSTGNPAGSPSRVIPIAGPWD